MTHIHSVGCRSVLFHMEREFSTRYPRPISRPMTPHAEWMYNPSRWVDADVVWCTQHLSVWAPRTSYDDVVLTNDISKLECSQQYLVCWEGQVRDYDIGISWVLLTCFWSPNSTPLLNMTSPQLFSYFTNFYLLHGECIGKNHGIDY